MLLEFPVIFHSHGVPLVGRFVRNSDSLHEPQPGVIVTGSWLTVKEQMPLLYARRLAEAGYTAFVFDFAGFGESLGEPRQTEIPARKIDDILAAVGFLQTISFVDGGQIGCLAVCTSAQYILTALARGAPVRSFVSVAGWYHDPVSVAPFYGGDSGVATRIGRARVAMETYVRTGQLVMVPAYKEGDERAAMFYRLDYYGLPERGAVSAWKNEMAEMTWLYWFAFDGSSAAPRVATPSLFVHSDGCVFPDRVKQVYAELRGPKELVWSEGSQIDFYDQPKQVDTAVSAATKWFAETLPAARRQSHPSYTRPG
jgi:fermentation-respiration switch protein FrsA (DUF1100 family)